MALRFAGIAQGCSSGSLKRMYYRRRLCNGGAITDILKRSVSGSQRSCVPAAMVTDDFHGGMEITFLGTGAGRPCTARGSSSVLLSLAGTFSNDPQSYMFDCGEGTQMQLMKSHVRFCRIRRIFISHMHGDHVLGLPGLIASIAESRRGELDSIEQSAANKRHRHHRSALGSNRRRLDIYGPRGLFELVETTLVLTHTRLPESVDVVVHEMLAPNTRPPADIPPLPSHLSASNSMGSTAPNPNDSNKQADSNALGSSTLALASEGQQAQGIRRRRGPRTEHLYRAFVESGVGKEGYPFWTLVSDGVASVIAGRMHHTVEGFGFVVEEAPRPGMFNLEKAVSLGIPRGPLFSVLQKGNPIELEDGRIVHPEEVLGPPRKGKKLVIMGDTSSGVGIEALARDADVLVHEATLADEAWQKALNGGHSTPGMAGSFARKVRAGHLILTHFSNRYRSLVDEVNAVNGDTVPMDGRAAIEDHRPRSTLDQQCRIQKQQADKVDKSPAEYDRSIERLVDQAKMTFRSGNVIAAKDFMTLRVSKENSQRGRKTERREPRAMHAKSQAFVVANQSGGRQKTVAQRVLAL